MTLASTPAESQAPPTTTGDLPHGRPAQSSARGILLLIASTIVFSVCDVCTKYLASSMPVVEIAWIRYATFACLIVPLVLFTSGKRLLLARRPGLQVIRTLGMLGSTLFFAMGLRTLPLAEATAIYFISPILIMGLSIVFLGESVGWRRWAAAAVGLLGVVVVIRPGTDAFQAAALLPLLGAVSWAAGAIVTRKMSGNDHPLTTLVYSAVVASLILSVPLPFSWVTPAGDQVVAALVMGLFFTIGQWFVVMAYLHGNASVIAPFFYVQLIWSGLLSFLAFGAVPDGWTIAGASIIAASGLYTAYRERVRSTSRRTAGA